MPTQQPYWRTYQGWSGVNLPGTAEFVLTPKQKTHHLTRAFWLASKVETSGKFGAVNSYDGCALTCGLDQKTAIFPKLMTQGGLWRVVRRLLDLETPNGHRVQDLLDRWRWQVSPDGVLRYTGSGSAVGATEIRDTLSPPGGKVPQAGPEWDQAWEVAESFRNLYADSATWTLQVGIGVESLVVGQRRVETGAYQHRTGLMNPAVATVGKDIPGDLDLAFCVYHAYSVHAPSVAAKVLQTRITASDAARATTRRFAQDLIRDFGTHPYKRWRDQPDNQASRYDRTRVHAMRSGLWAAEFFHGPVALMPENLT